MLLCQKEMSEEIVMNYQILTTSTYAKQILDDNTHGIVHSIYRNTINVSVGKYLLALQTKNSPLSPISLITNLGPRQIEKLGLKVGDPIQILLQNRTEIYNLSPELVFPKQFRQELFMKIRRSIISTQTSGFSLIFHHSDSVENDMILRVAKNRMESAYHFYQKHDFENACKDLSKLIGLGIGLTPSGDDFLCGILAGLTLVNRQNHTFTKCLQYYIQQNLKNTNEISQAFLRCALGNHFSYAVNFLWNNPPLEDITKEFLNIGHSSGIDTLCGIYYALLLWKE